MRPAFRMTVEDDLIRKNLFDWQLATVLINDSVKREVLTPRQERLFLDFIKGDKHYSQYYEGMFILFKTGMRVSEFCGLTLSDVDMKARKIRVDHQLQRTRGELHDSRYQDNLWGAFTANDGGGLSML